MKQRAVIVFGNSVFRNKSDSVFAEIGEKLVKLSRQFELVVFYDHSFYPDNIFPIAIKNAFLKADKNQKIVSIDSKIVVDKDDSAFRNPSVFAGPSLTCREALKIAKTTKKIIKKDSNGNLRRLVPSPDPIDIVEKREISDLLSMKVLVIASGETVVYKTKILKLLKFADAVVDRDLAAEKLAEKISADIFVSVMDIGNACLNYGTENELKLFNLTPREIENYSKMNQFPKDSIGKKLEACKKFAKKKKTGIICSISNLEMATKRQAGTIVE